MASKSLVLRVLQQARIMPNRFGAMTPRMTIGTTSTSLQSHYLPARYLSTTRPLFLDAKPESAAAQSIVIPPAQPPPPEDPNPNKNAAFLGEADSDDGFEASKAVDGDPQPSLDAQNSAFHGEADSDDGFEAAKIVDGEKLEAVDATNSAFLGEADGDDGFVAHREAHPEEGDHKITDPVESGFHGSPGEHDQ